jgi:hypothetical protein
MEFIVSESPTVDVALRRYDSDLFPKFRAIFEPSEKDSLLRFFAQPPEEAEFALVMENRAGKDVTALRYNWIMTAEDGNVRKHKVSSDSYMVDEYQPVLQPNDGLLICRSTSIHESLLDHVLNGGGTIGSGSGRQSSLVGIKSLRFEIDMLLFADGEIVGPNNEGFAAELRFRKPAAEFIANQVRTAESKSWDVIPVLSALSEVPHLGDDFLAHWTRHYASWLLRHMGHERTKDALLHHLENRPTLPTFYRREGGVR